ncbi:MAG: arylsulfatase [Gemmatimonadota bacterium]
MSAAPPNLVYILADDMGYGDVSCLNPESRIPTRYLDQLAADGLACHDAHASSAVCTPSRYSILTGRYSWRSALKQGVTFGYDGPLVEPGRLTVASLLRSQGYATACVGKWHLGWSWARHSGDPEDVDYGRPIEGGPTSAGFDYFYGIPASLDMAPYVYVENDRVTAVPQDTTPGSEGKAFWRPGPIAPDFDHADVLPHLTGKVLEFIDRQASAGHPFFVYFPLPAPHTPILPAPRFRGRSGTNEYGDFCLQVDDVVGQVMACLERCGSAADTILVFASDNGCSPTAGFEELAAVGHRPSYLFRGHKADIYEGGHRIPLLLRWPARIPAASVVDQTVCLTDLLATCAELLGVRLPAAAGEDSVSNLALWTGAGGAGPGREATVHTSIDGSLSIRRGRWKLEMCAGSGGWSWPRPGPECQGLPPVQLYDLEADIGEGDNLQDRHPAVVAELRALLARYVRQGRSTPGPRQANAGGHWDQLWFVAPDWREVRR